MMTLAHVRGLLKRGYRNGIRSIHRENLMLEYLSNEQTAGAMALSVQMHASMAPIIEPNARNSFLKSLNTQIKNIQMILEMDHEGLEAEKRFKGLDDNTFAKLYSYLREHMAGARVPAQDIEPLHKGDT